MAAANVNKPFGKLSKGTSSEDKRRERILDKFSEIVPTTDESFRRDKIEKDDRLVRLLAAISHCVDDDGMSQKCRQTIEQARAALDVEKQKYFQNLLLHSELQDLTLYGSSSAKQESVDRLTGLLTNVEISFGLRESSAATPSEMSNISQSSASSGSSAGSTGQSGGTNVGVGQLPTILGLSKRHFSKEIRSQMLDESSRDETLTHVESSLEDKCSDLCEFFTGSSDHKSLSSETVDENKAGRDLMRAVEETKSRVERDEQLLKKQKQDHRKISAVYERSLTESLQVMAELLSRHRMQAGSEADRINTEWLEARCVTTSLKIRVLELQLLCETYERNTASSALHNIRRELNLCISEAQKELAEASRALESYEQVGPEFRSLVERYTKLRIDVENKSWALRELKAHDDT